LAALPIHAKSGREWGPKAQPNERTSRDGNFVFWIDFRGSATEDSVAFCFPGSFATLLPAWDWDWVWVWVAPGPPKGHPSVAQGRPKGRIAEVLCLQQKLKKGGDGWARGFFITEASRPPKRALKNVFLGPAAAAEPIPRVLFWLLCPFTPKAGANGARKRSQTCGPLGMATLRSRHFREGHADD